MKNVILSILLIFAVISFSKGQIIGNPTHQVPSHANKYSIKNCFNLELKNTSGSWKLSGVKQKSTYWDGFNVGICTDSPEFPLHVNSQAKINSLIVGNIDGRKNNGHLNIAASQDYNNGAEITLFDNKDGGGYGRINFTSGNGNSNKGYGFVFANYNGNRHSNQMIIRKNGKVSIGDVKSVNGNYKLFVEDGILTERVKVAINGSANWADFVFASNYQLPTLETVEAFIIKNKHLPEIPSAEDMVENGLDVAEMDAKLLQKVEELTLYLIEQNKRIHELEEQIKLLKK